VGGVAVLLLLCRAIMFMYRMWVGGRQPRATAGSWAVVTGASDGIGREFAVQLSRAGYHVVLLSRTRSKLDEVAALCRQAGVETKVIPVDFAQPPSAYGDELQRHIAPLHVEVLVNNVGLSFPFPEHFLKTDPALDDQIVNINIQSMLRMTRIVLPGMVERRRGFVVNVGSFSGAVPVPLLSTYSASKAFVRYFSESLSVEYGRHGVAVQCVEPMFVATEMAKMRPSLTVPTPARLVADTLRRLGGGQTSFSPYFAHSIMGGLLTSLPDCVRNPLLYSQNLGTQQRAIRRMEREKAKAT
jgi:17beta-estradiol 17-dehydrogenase / very-long-chain 3-oxoacyl-CoA reductase